MTSARGSRGGKSSALFFDSVDYWSGSGVLWALFGVLMPCSALAVGSGLNTVVVVNQTSSNSLALGNYYCERRQVPAQNLLRISWSGANTAWTLTQMETALLTPLRTMLTNRTLAGQVDYVVVGPDIPYRVTSGNTANSTTSVLFYGFKTNPPAVGGACVISDASSSGYSFSEAVFRFSPPVATAPCFLATMITGRTLDLARALVDHGVGSDATFPKQPVVLAKTGDTARNVRYFAFDNALFDLHINGQFPAIRTNSSQTEGLSGLLGLQTGLAALTLSSNTFVAGAMGDSLTSFGGMLFENSGQTSLLAFTEAGAAASYGTVTEPCNYQAKFPDPMNYFYLARGFSLAECYYLSLISPYQGVVVGEPLAAPFARAGSGRWLDPEDNSDLSGQAPFTVEFDAADPGRPLQQIDLFIDGVKTLTLTNVAPSAGNELNLQVNGQTLSYTVPEEATLSSLAEEMADALNAEDFSAAARLRAFGIGDRLELDFIDLTPAGAEVSVSATSRATGTEALTTYLTAARTNFLDTSARGWRSWKVSGTAVPGDFLQATITKTNGEEVVLGVTNLLPSLSSAQLAAQLLAKINSHPVLKTADGVVEEDAYTGATNYTFLLYARAAGFSPAQIRVQFLGSTNLPITPTNVLALDQNLGDLRPRNHVYLSAGVTNLRAFFSLDTTRLTDGYHQLTAVAYEGSHIRTQTRISKDVVVRNSALAAQLTHSAPSGYGKVGDTLQFIVSANTNTVARIELLSTGGMVGVSSNQPQAEFAVPGAQLGEGLHPFYALVVDETGQGFRTQTHWIRLTNAPALRPFSVQIGEFPPRLAWLGTGGYDYEVLSADQVPGSYSIRDLLSATNTGLLEWIEPETNEWQRFYRVRARGR